MVTSFHGSIKHPLNIAVPAVVVFSMTPLQVSHHDVQCSGAASVTTVHNGCRSDELVLYMKEIWGNANVTQ